MERGALVALGLCKGRRGQPAPGDEHARGLRERLRGVERELKAVDRRDHIELLVEERERVHLALHERAVRGALARDLEQGRRDVDAGDRRAAGGGECGGIARAAGDVEQAGVRPRLGLVEQFGEQSVVLRLGDLRPVAWVRAPQLALLVDDRLVAHRAGSMFWFRRNTLSGSYIALIS